MSRPTRVIIDPTALLHNVKQIRKLSPDKKIVAMVKANAYGCGVSHVIPVLEGKIDAFGVACLEEALAIRNLGSYSDCILFQGVFNKEELDIAAKNNFQCVIHQANQLSWLIQSPLSKPVKVWVKIDTGMHRLGFNPAEVYEVIQALARCSWVDNEIGLMTHFACADEPGKESNREQLQLFKNLVLPQGNYIKSLANSAAILSLPEAHADVVRPGIMLYGVSPFAGKTGHELGLRPVMQFTSAISAIHRYPAHSPIGYGGAWQSSTPSIIGLVPAGYGDGYPRHVHNAKINVNGIEVPIVGRISMDMLTIDLTQCPYVKIGDPVELWGKNLPVESIAQAADTIPYELLCQITRRVLI